MRWSTDHKSLALSLLHSSPKTYKLLRKVFSLPSVRTLRQAMHNTLFLYATILEESIHTVTVACRYVVGSILISKH